MLYYIKCGSRLISLTSEEPEKILKRVRRKNILFSGADTASCISISTCDYRLPTVMCFHSNIRFKEVNRRQYRSSFMSAGKVSSYLN